MKRKRRKMYSSESRKTSSINWCILLCAAWCVFMACFWLSFLCFQTVFFSSSISFSRTRKSRISIVVGVKFTFLAFEHFYHSSNESLFLARVWNALRCRQYFFSRSGHDAMPSPVRESRTRRKKVHAEMQSILFSEKKNATSRVRNGNDINMR